MTSKVLLRFGLVVILCVGPVRKAVGQASLVGPDDDGRRWDQAGEPRDFAGPRIPANGSEDAFVVVRLNAGRPVVAERLFDRAGASSYEGENINGPSVIRVPEWISPRDRADPTARYYMYFAHHRGNYLRMAWANRIEGPWHLFRIGATVSPGRRGVLDLGAEDAIDVGNGLVILDHIASPDVSVDDESRRIVMYFHAPTEFEGTPLGQKTFAATSPDGLDFFEGVEPVVLGKFYFRVFSYADELYAIANHGDFFQAPDPGNPWTPPVDFDFAEDLWRARTDNPFSSDIADDGLSPLILRHSTVRLVGDTLQILYTRIGDSPERILQSTIDVAAGDFDAWDTSYPPEEILRAELGWEGADIRPVPSRHGPAPEQVNELRDPYLFEDIDGSLYLFYTGMGEDAIGIAKLAQDGEFDPTDISTGQALTQGK